MKKLLLAALFCTSVPTFAQTETPPTPETTTPETPAPAPPAAPAETKPKADSIAGMIASCDRFYTNMSSLFGGDDRKADTSFLSGINFPNSVAVTYLAQTRKMSKSRGKIVAEWLKKYQNRAGDKKLYQNEILASENGVNYWIIARDEVAAALAARKKDETVTLQLKILGFERKKGVTDYFLLADGIK